MQVLSTLTNEMADCTIEQGICGIGRLADIDLFAAFTVEMNERGMDLWQVKDRRDRTVVDKRAEKHVQPKRTAEQLRADYEAAEQLSREAGLADEDYISPFPLDGE